MEMNQGELGFFTSIVCFFIKSLELLLHLRNRLQSFHFLFRSRIKRSRRL